MEYLQMTSYACQHPHQASPSSKTLEICHDPRTAGLGGDISGTSNLVPLRGSVEDSEYIYKVWRCVCVTHLVTLQCHSELTGSTDFYRCHMPKCPSCTR